MDQARDISAATSALAANRLRALILFMARAAGVVEVAASGENAVRFLFVRGREGGLSGGDETLCIRQPLALVDEAIADEEHVARLHDRRSAVAHRCPLLVVLRRNLLDF